MRILKSFQKTPSYYMKIPYDSVLQKTEAEVVACNIMVILNRTGNVFRPLSWEEYKKERLKDKNFSEKEKRFFKDVIRYCKSPDTASLFSKHWA